MAHLLLCFFFCLFRLENCLFCFGFGYFGVGDLGLACGTGLVCYKTGFKFGFWVLLEVFVLCCFSVLIFVVGCL